MIPLQEHFRRLTLGVLADAPDHVRAAALPPVACLVGAAPENPITRLVRECHLPPLIDPAVAELLTPPCLVTARELVPKLFPELIRSAAR